MKYYQRCTTSSPRASLFHTIKIQQRFDIVHDNGGANVETTPELSPIGLDER